LIGSNLPTSYHLMTELFSVPNCKQYANNINLNVVSLYRSYIYNVYTYNYILTNNMSCCVDSLEHDATN